MKVKQFLQEGGNAKKLRVPAGETILAQNEDSKEMYFIDTGKVSVLRRVPELGREIEIATLASGDFFGELAIMRGSPRMADVVAVTDCELWTLDKDSFKDAIRKSPAFALAVVEGLCHKLDAVNQKNEDTFAKFKEFTTRFEDVSVLWHSLVPY